MTNKTEFNNLTTKQLIAQIKRANPSSAWTKTAFAELRQRKRNLQEQLHNLGQNRDNVVGIPPDKVELIFERQGSSDLDNRNQIEESLQVWSDYLNTSELAKQQTRSMLSALDRAVQKLDNQKRKVVIDYYFLNKPTAVIAEETKMKPATIRVILHRAKAEITKSLEGEFTEELLDLVLLKKID